MLRNWSRSSRTLFVATSTPAVRALRQQTRAIPIVFAIVTDPVSSGFVTSLGSPGGDTTGFTNFEFTWVGSGLRCSSEIAPRVAQGRAYLQP